MPKTVFFDLETTGLNVNFDTILCVAWKVNDGPIKTAVPPTSPGSGSHDFKDFRNDFLWADVLGGHNLSFDLKFMKVRYREMNDRADFIDTYIIYHYKDPHNSCKLKDLGERILNREVIRIKDLTGSGKNKMQTAEIPIKDLLNYCSQDVALCYALYQKHLEEENRLIIRDRILQFKGD